MNQSPPKKVKHIGLDVHATSHDVAVAESGCEEVRYYGQIPGTLEAVDKLLRKLGGEGVELRVCYEAGPTGYGLARHLLARGIDCRVVAPGLIPRKVGERVKTNRLDAQRLARLSRAEELTFVHVPDPGDEAIRDLVRSRAAAVEDLRRQRQRMLGLLLRQGRLYPGKGRNWTRAHKAFMAAMEWEREEHHFLCQEMLQAIDTEQARVDRMTEALEKRLAGWRWAKVVAALRCLRGFDTVSAMTMVAEVGDFSRFESPEQLSAYLGLVPGEESTGNRRIQGSITKTGNAACRRTLVEAAHHYRCTPAVGALLRGRQEGQPEAVVAHAWQAQVRLCGRFTHLKSQHKKTVVVVTAVARELAGFVWAVAMLAMDKKLPERRHRRASPRARLGTASEGVSGHSEKTKTAPPTTKKPRIYELRQMEKAGVEVARERPSRRRSATGPNA